MPLITVGISHHTAPLDIRERLAFARPDYARIASELNALPEIREAVVLSTCNRTEVYAVAAADKLAQVTDWLAAKGRAGSGDELNAGYFYSHTGSQAVHHLFRVACGLDSLVLGEPQIIGQLKDAWQGAKEAGSAGKITDRLFQRAFATSKKIRNATGINEHPVSVAYISTILAAQIFGDLASKQVLMIGAGEMVELCGRHFHQQGIQGLTIANRSIERANTLAAEFQAKSIALDQLDQHLGAADIIISSTASREPILSRAQMERAVAERRHRPVFLIDLGVPRDIDPEVAQLRDVYLYTIDDLQQVADDNQDQRQQAADAAMEYIDEAADEFMRWSHGVRAARSLQQIRQQAEINGKELAEKALRKIDAGGDAHAIVSQLTNTLIHKMLHRPSERLREAAEREDYQVLEAAEWLFDQDVQDEQDEHDPGPGESES